MSRADEILNELENPTGKPYGGAKVWFDVVKELNHQKTEKENMPVYDFVEVIKVQHPGEPTPNVKRAKDADKAAYAAEYKRFKEGEEAPPVEGTPLFEWSMMPRSLALELEGKGIFTVQQLADLPENYGAAYASLGPAQEWCMKAKDELQRAETGAKVTTLKAENRKLRAEIKGLQEQVQRLSYRLEMEQGPNDHNTIGDLS